MAHALDAPDANLVGNFINDAVVAHADAPVVFAPGEFAAAGPARVRRECLNRPAALTIGRLRLPHASIPRNPLIAEPMFLARYAEKAGSGILDMIKLCAQANLPTPEFRQSGGQFSRWPPQQTVFADTF